MWQTTCFWGDIKQLYCYFEWFIDINQQANVVYCLLLYTGRRRLTTCSTYDYNIITMAQWVEFGTFLLLVVMLCGSREALVSNPGLAGQN